MQKQEKKINDLETAYMRIFAENCSLKDEIAELKKEIKWWKKNAKNCHA